MGANTIGKPYPAELRDHRLSLPPLTFTRFVR